MVYPVGLRLTGRRVVVVGGGQVAHRRVAGLLEAGADVTVVSPDVTPALEGLVTPGSLTWVRRRYEPGDQSSKHEKGDGEKKSYRFGTTETAPAHFGDEWVKQISENYSDSDRNQDWLKEANDIGASPDDCANYDDKKYNEERRESRPHRFALPDSRIFLHASGTCCSLVLRELVLDRHLVIESHQSLLAHGG